MRSPLFILLFFIAISSGDYDVEVEKRSRRLFISHTISPVELTREWLYFDREACNDIPSEGFDAKTRPGRGACTVFWNEKDCKGNWIAFLSGYYRGNYDIDCLHTAKSAQQPLSVSRCNATISDYVGDGGMVVKYCAHL